MLTPKFFIAKFIVTRKFLYVNYRITRKFSYTKRRITPKCLLKGTLLLSMINKKNMENRSI